MEIYSGISIEIKSTILTSEAQIFVNKKKKQSKIVIKYFQSYIKL